MSAPRPIAPLTPAKLPRLAARLAPLPLFRRYGLDAAALVARWRGALTSPGQRLLGVADGAGPCGLIWFAVDGTFGTAAYVRQLALAAGAQRRGDGGRLLATFEAEAAGAPGGFFLLVSASNRRARRFYAAHGYRDVGALPGFVRRGLTERIMWRRPGACRT